MVDYAQPAPQLELSEAPKTQVDSSVFSRPLLTSAVAQGAEELGQGAGQLADSLAKQQAQEDVKNTAVTLDANGVPQIATPSNSIILGQAGTAYAQARAAGLRARLASDVSGRVEALHLANEDNPQGFKKDADDYINGLRNGPSLGAELGNQLADQAANEASQRFANISEKMFEIGTRTSEQGIQTRISDLSNRMQNAARSGGTTAMATPAYQQWDAELGSLYGSLKDSKLFGYSPERADSLLAATRAMRRGRQSSGKLTRPSVGPAAMVAGRARRRRSIRLSPTQPCRSWLPRSSPPSKAWGSITSPI